MTPTSTGDSSSIFKDGKLKQGIYKIQSLYNQTFLNIQEHSREIYCRSVQSVGEGWGLWEIKPLEAGYTIQRVEPGKPGQFCAPMAGLENGCPLSVCAYPVAWRIEIVNDDIHRGFEYVRVYWGTTDILWDITLHNTPGSKLGVWKRNGETYPWWIWKLIPVNVETFGETVKSSGLDTLPSYSGSATGQSSTHTQRTEYEHDGFGTIVTEVTIVTTCRR